MDAAPAGRCFVGRLHRGGLAAKAAEGAPPRDAAGGRRSRGWSAHRPRSVTRVRAGVGNAGFHAPVDGRPAGGAVGRAGPRRAARSRARRTRMSAPRSSTSTRSRVTPGSSNRKRSSSRSRTLLTGIGKGAATGRCGDVAQPVGIGNQPGGLQLGTSGGATECECDDPPDNPQDAPDRTPRSTRGSGRKINVFFVMGASGRDVLRRRLDTDAAAHDRRDRRDALLIPELACGPSKPASAARSPSRVSAR